MRMIKLLNRILRLACIGGMTYDSWIGYSDGILMLEVLYLGTFLLNIETSMEEK